MVSRVPRRPRREGSNHGGESGKSPVKTAGSPRATRIVVTPRPSNEASRAAVTSNCIRASPGRLRRRECAEFAQGDLRLPRTAPGSPRADPATPSSCRRVRPATYFDAASFARVSPQGALQALELELEPVGVGSVVVQVLIRVALVAAALQHCGMGECDPTGLLRGERETSTGPAGPARNAGCGSSCAEILK